MSENKPDANENLDEEINGAEQNDSELDAGFAAASGDAEVKDDTDADDKGDSDAQAEEADEASREDAASDGKSADESDKAEDKVDDKPLTVEEKILKAAEAMDKPADKPAPTDDEDFDILDKVDPSYSWARSARESGKLAEFFKTQPKSVQRLAMSKDPDDAMYALDLYKKSTEVAAPAKTEVKSVLADYGDVEVRQADGTMMKLKDIAKEYGNAEMFEAFAAMTAKMLEKNKPEAPVSKAEDYSAIQREIAQIKADNAFWDEVTDAHSDAKKIWRSGALKKWVDEQKKPQLARLYTSPNPEHAILVFDAYKESIAKASKEKAGAEAAVKHKKNIDLHRETVSSKRNIKTGAKSETPSDNDDGFDAGFNAAMQE